MDIHVKLRRAPFVSSFKTRTTKAYYNRVKNLIFKLKNQSIPLTSVAQSDHFHCAAIFPPQLLSERGMSVFTKGEVSDDISAFSL